MSTPFASKTPEARRKAECKRLGRFAENAAGKWVRAKGFREIDYDPENPDRLREFDSFDDAFAFDEKCRIDGTGGLKAKTWGKPKESVPREQLALEQSVKHAIKKDGNKTRVQLEQATVCTSATTSRRSSTRRRIACCARSGAC